MVLKRDGRCRLCGFTCSLEAHHVYPNLRDEKLRNSPANLVALCQIHHRVITIIQRRFPDIYFRFIAPRLLDANELFKLYIEEAKRMRREMER